MPSFKCSIGIMSGAKASDLYDTLSTAGLPDEDRMYGVLSCEKGPDGIKLRLAQRARRGVKNLDRKKKALRDGEATTYRETRVLMLDADGLVKASGGGKVLAGVEQALCELATNPNTIEPVTIKPIPFDPVAACVKLLTAVSDCHVLACKLDSYVVDPETGGPYTPKFSGPARGLEFLQEDSYRKHVVVVRVGWKGAAGKVKMTLCKQAAFAWSCKSEDLPAVEKLIEELALRMSAIPARDAGPLFPESGKATTPANQPTIPANAGLGKKRRKAAVA